MAISIMKIRDQLQHLFHKSEPTKDVYLSLTLFHQQISGCVWTIGQEAVLDIINCAHTKSQDVSWEKRIEAVDEVVSLLEEKSGVGELHKTVLGFAPEFLTGEGNINKAIRADIKRMTTLLDLQPVGFVNIETAIVFQIKHEEGVPPSIILIHVAGGEMTVSLYRVGNLVGERSVHISEFVVEDVEKAIKSFSDVEVLPSRMILFGEDKEELETIKSQLLTHQWTTRANFLHYPTIDVFESEQVARAVALAGASELTASYVEEKIEEKETEKAIGEETIAETVVAQQDIENTDEKTIEEVIQEEQIAAPAKQYVEDKEEIKEESDMLDENEELPEVHPEDANVVPVAPESLGFHQETDVLEQPVIQQQMHHEIKESDETDEPKQSFFVAVKEKIVSLFAAIRTPSTRVSTKFPVIPIALVFFLSLGVFSLLYYFIPKATVTIGVIPHSIQKSKTLTISTTATVVDQEKFIIPGKKLEQSVTGEKTAAVTGKKRIGDPAKGTVVIYNKAVSSRVLKKGTVLVSGNSLQFTLDSEITIASASESIGSITFGKTIAAVTAASIGEEGNLAAGSDFTFKDLSSGIAIARNDQAFSGGTSRETTVVSRSDYDAMVKALSDELVTKAKTDLLAGVAGEEKLIDSTIKTTVTSKTFREELDQETTELHGKVTLTISGISYNEKDSKSVLVPLASSEIPSGYGMNEGRTTVTIDTPTIKKDGTITAISSISLVSLPTVDVEMVKKELVGKTIVASQEIIKKLQGVGSVEFFFSKAVNKKRLPFNPANITVDVVVVQ
ncbi:MAG: hypothetical protein WAV51_03905 [Microgenomates group bacterium]